MNKSLFSLLLVGILGITGCKKFLTVIPEDFVAPENYFNKEQDAVLALNAAFFDLKDLNFLGGLWLARGVADADDAYSVLEGNYIANHKAPTNDAAFSNHWTAAYRTIEKCNVLLANIDRVEMDETKRSVIKGEGLFLRAYCYFFLVTQWGAVPLKLAPTADPTDIRIPRTPVAEVYDQILRDMTYAESVVPPASQEQYGAADYPSRSAVQAMLARVCLSMAGEPLKDVSKYAAARDWAKKVVDSKLHSLNPSFEDVFVKLISNQYDKKESIWEIDYADVPGPRQSSYIGYLDGIIGSPADSGTMLGQVHATRLLYNLYGSKDLRRDWTIAPFIFTATGTKTYWSSTQLYDRCIGKFRLNVSPMPRVNSRSPVNFPVIRYSDVLLMLAEAENEVNDGPTQLAYDCINQVRARAYGKLLPGATDPTEADLPPGLNEELFLIEIQDERARELAFEGLRKNDLIRWGIFFSRLQAMKADVNDTGQPAVVARQKTNIINLVDRATEKWRLWPIPPNEIALNSEVTQNPGW
ncbi:RagB/SusD family nutrient uptake outer membrane protein [Niabella aurantiaca]|uniref:RagB/SusD family nutrient uptake outer membrane protein n=1 Tax=Niabella aurantiaca TaxID=379900 RepID=UPI00037F7A81|nr:RagB/SusD family nutrient uptake outer membrane protein [Niabella aurantiaca]